MAYTIKYQGYDVTCDTVADLQALVSQNGNDNGKVAKESHIKPTHEEPPTALADVVGRLRKEQRDLLRHIASNGTVPRDRLFQVAGVSDPREFAGLLIGISKTCTWAKIESPIEKITARANGNGPREYHYKIRDDMKADVKAALSQ